MTEKQYEKIETNLNAFAFNFGMPRIVDGYNGGYYVYPADSEEYIQYCRNIDYLNGWLYGAVQGALILKRRSER